MNTHPQSDIPVFPFPDAQLRGLVRYKLLTGSLREDVMHDAFGGISAGGRCCVCDLSILRGHAEIRTYAHAGARSYHPKCHLLLSAELEDLAQQ